APGTGTGIGAAANTIDITGTAGTATVAAEADTGGIFIAATGGIQLDLGPVVSVSNPGPGDKTGLVTPGASGADIEVTNLGGIIEIANGGIDSDAAVVLSVIDSTVTPATSTGTIRAAAADNNDGTVEITVNGDLTLEGSTIGGTLGGGQLEIDGDASATDTLAIVTNGGVGQDTNLEVQTDDFGVIDIRQDDADALIDIDLAGGTDVVDINGDGAGNSRVDISNVNTTANDIDVLYELTDAGMDVRIISATIAANNGDVSVISPNDITVGTGAGTAINVGGGNADVNLRAPNGDIIDGGGAIVMGGGDLLLIAGNGVGTLANPIATTNLLDVAVAAANGGGTDGVFIENTGGSTINVTTVAAIVGAAPTAGISSNGGDIQINGQAGTFGTSATGVVDATGATDGDVDIIADSITDILAAVSGANVTFRPSPPGTAMSLGNAAGGFTISDAEILLLNITDAVNGILTFGDAFAGPMTITTADFVTGVANPANTVAIVNNATIIDSNTGTGELAVPNILSMTTNGAIGSGPNPLDTDALSLVIPATNGNNAFIQDDGDFNTELTNVQVAGGMFDFTQLGTTDVTVGVVNSTSTVDIDVQGGQIDDAAVDTVTDISGTTVTITARDGVGFVQRLETESTALDVSVTGTGAGVEGIFLTELDGTDLTDIDTVEDVIDIVSTTGNLTVGDVDAGTGTPTTANIEATAGDIQDSTVDTTTDVSGTTLTLTSRDGVGDTAAIETESDSLDVSATAAGGAIDIRENSGNGTELTDLDTIDGSINVLSPAGDLTIGIVEAGTTTPNTATIEATTGSIEDVSDPDTIVVDVLGTTVTLLAQDGIGNPTDVETDSDTLIARVTGTGNIVINEKSVDGTDLSDVDTADGSITVPSDGAVTATDVQSRTDSLGNDIAITTNTGDILVGSIQIGTQNGDNPITADVGHVPAVNADVTLISDSAINDAQVDGDAVGDDDDIIGNIVNLTSGTTPVPGIGNINPLEVVANTVNLAGSGGIGLSVTGSVNLGNFDTLGADININATIDIDVIGDVTTGTTAGNPGAGPFGNVTLRADSNGDFTEGGGVQATDDIRVAAGGSIHVGDGTLTLAGADAIFETGGPLSGPGGLLIIEPSAAARHMAIGDGADTTGAFGAGNFMFVDTTEIAEFQDGFNRITFGRADGTQTIQIGDSATSDTLTFLDAVTFSAPAGAGAINVDATNLRFEELAVGTVIFDGPGATTTLSGFQVSAGIPIIFSDAVELNSDVLIASTLDLTGPDFFDGAGAEIRFEGTLDSTVGNTFRLVTDAGTTGDVNFMGAVGTTDALGDVVVFRANNVTASSTFESDSFIQHTGSGTTTFANVLTTNGNYTAADETALNAVGAPFNILDVLGPLATLPTEQVYNLDKALDYGIDIETQAIDFQHNVVVGGSNPVLLTTNNLSLPPIGRTMLATGASIQIRTLPSVIGVPPTNTTTIGVNSNTQDMNLLDAELDRAVSQFLIIGEVTDATGSPSAVPGEADYDHADGLALAIRAGTDNPISRDRDFELRSSGQISIEGAVDTTTSGTFSIFTEHVATVPVPFSLVVNSAGDMNLDDAFHQFDTLGTATVSTGGDIITTGTNGGITFESPVTLTDSVLWSTTDGQPGDINLENTVVGNFNITLEAGSGATNFLMPVGGPDDPNAIGVGIGPAITINSEGVTNFQDTLRTRSGLLQAVNAGDVIFEGDVNLDLLGAGNVATIFNEDVRFDNLNSGNTTLTFTSGRSVTFGDGTTDLVTLDATGASTLMEVTIATNGAGVDDDVLFNAAVQGDPANGGQDLLLSVTGTTTFETTVGGTTVLTAIGDTDGADHADGTTDGSLVIKSTGPTLFKDTVLTTGGIEQDNAAGEITFENDVVNRGGITTNVAVGVGGTDANDSNYDANVEFNNVFSMITRLYYTSNGNVTFGNVIGADRVALSAEDPGQPQMDVVIRTVTSTGTDVDVLNTALASPTGDFGKDINFNSTIDSFQGVGEIDQRLIVNSGSGVTRFLGEVGGGLTVDGIAGSPALFSLHTEVDEATLAALDSLDADLQGPFGRSEVGADIFAEGGTIVFNDAVLLVNQDVTITDTGATGANFNSTVDGAFNLTLNVDAVTNFVGAVGSDPGGLAGQALGNPGADVATAITINSTGTTDFHNTVETVDGITQAVGAGLVTFEDNVTIGFTDTDSLFNENVTFDNPNSGAAALLFTSAGSVTFGTDNADLVTLAATGGSPTMPVTFQTTSATDARNDMTFNSRVTGAQDIVLDPQNATGLFTFINEVGDSAVPLIPIGDGTGIAIDMQGAGSYNFQNVVETASGINQAGAAGLVTFEDNVTVAAGDTDSTFDANVTFDNLNSGSATLTFTSAGNVRFGTGAGSIGTDQVIVASTGVDMPVTIDTSVAGTNVEFNAAVNSPTGDPEELRVNSGAGTTSFRGDIGVAGGGLDILKGLTTEFGGVGIGVTEFGNTDAPAANMFVRTNGIGQTYNDPVLFVGDTTFFTTAGPANFNDTVDTATGLAAGAGDVTLDIFGST
ncbi:MAG: hypothetical protein CMJ49_00735, partial [Planctomycetaceae bacterium]|nr:hypothetical protein [Planctomycetaceae bacterium]